MNAANMQALLAKTAHKMTEVKQNGFEETCPIGIIDIENWEWSQGIGMYGLYQYYLISEDKTYLDYLLKWYDRNISKGLPDKNVNTMAPMLTLAYLTEETGREDYKALCEEWAAWVMYEMPRTREGGIQHIVSGEENPQQLWIDTLFMTVLFLAKMGTMLQNKDYIEEAKYQFLLHIKYLYDTETGLWFHGWTFLDRNNFAAARWARGNCWYTAGVVELIEMLEPGGAFQRYLLETLRAQAEALRKMQDSTGGWHTLLDIPDSYLEASATAGFAYGLLKAVRKGYLDDSYQVTGRKALDYVMEQIDENGQVNQVSYGTGMGMDLKHYQTIPLCPMTYGQALAIMALSEGIRVEKKQD